jgi:hypothetical protein
MHDFCDFFVAKLFHLAKNQGCSQFVGQLTKQLFNQNFVLNIATSIWLARIELNQFWSLQPQSIHAESNTNSIQEAAEGAVISEFSDLSEGFQEGFLGNILGLKSVAQEVRGGSQQPVAVSLDKVANGDVVSRSYAAHPLTLLRRWVHRHD